MQVTKRDGNLQAVCFDKITARYRKLCENMGLDRIDPVEIAQKVIRNIVNGMKTSELDEHASDICKINAMRDPQYCRLSAGIKISNLHKNTSDNFMHVTNKLWKNENINGQRYPLISKKYYDIVKNNIDIIQRELNYNNDYKYDIFGYATLCRLYLQKITNPKTREESIIERPQHMLMRTALATNPHNIDHAITAYKLMSELAYTHATPTLSNSGSHVQQMSSCYLLGMNDDLSDIFDAIKKIGMISKWSGGIGINLSEIRAKGTLISGTNGKTDGVMPLNHVLNSVGKYVNQGGKRNGAIAVFIEPWHADIFDVIQMRQNKGQEHLKVKDIFIGCWVNDIFMERVKDDKVWSLMCPHECPGLTDSYGKDFDKLYKLYEKMGKYKKQIRARELMDKIIVAQGESGMPYQMYKDSVNKKNNLKMYSIIKNSNLCTEIVQPSSQEETAVCNLASISLPNMIINGEYDFNKLGAVTRVAIRSLDNVIDENFYPVESAKKSNLLHRPIGLGVQGFANTLNKLKISWNSEQAKILNKKIFETIYYNALFSSCELAKEKGAFKSFKYSEFSKGILQYHMHGLTEDDLLMGFDWKSLVEDIKKYGIRNSYLTSIMPTASTAQLLGNSEGIEPYLSNIFKRSVSSGDFVVLNNTLVETLIENNLWNDDIMAEILYDNGSIENIASIPKNIKDIYKTVYEIKNKTLMDMSSDRSPFIDQTQSLNLFSNNPTKKLIERCHFYGWEKGLKTGMYYFRTCPATSGIKYGIDPQKIKEIELRRANSKNIYKKKTVSSGVDNYSVCEACS